ncbi:MAG: DUF6153 family protein [Nocardioides sp.]|nr:DUF6153 family protein [Nocardioides sp.]
MQKSSGPSRWLISGVAALLLGILGMHALGLHGVPPPVAPGTSHAGTATTPAHLPATSSLHAAPNTDEQARGIHNGTHDNRGTHAMAGLCVALLAVGALLLAARSALRTCRIRRFPTTLRTLLDPVVLRTGLPPGADNRPPYLWAFSVIRC